MKDQTLILIIFALAVLYMIRGKGTAATAPAAVAGTSLPDPLALVDQVADKVLEQLQPPSSA